jgi:hypothetical protein
MYFSYPFKTFLLGKNKTTCLEKLVEEIKPVLNHSQNLEEFLKKRGDVRNYRAVSLLKAINTPIADNILMSRDTAIWYLRQFMYEYRITYTQDSGLVKKVHLLNPKRSILYHLVDQICLPQFLNRDLKFHKTCCDWCKKMVTLYELRCHLSTHWGRFLEEHKKHSKVNTTHKFENQFTVIDHPLCKSYKTDQLGNSKVC